MNELMWRTYHRLIAEQAVESRRFLYHDFDLNQRLTGLVGARGVGKTTLMLQYIKEHLYADKQTFYFSADNTYFNEVSILSFVDDLYQNHGIMVFFIDEIHKYSNWNQELKNIYDSYPKVKVVFSGSSSIDLIEGSYDLSRRAKLYHLPGMSFREYLNIKTGSKLPAVKLEDLLENHLTIAAEISSVKAMKKHFDEYLKFGFYPIIFENSDHIYNALSNVIEKTVYEDIARFYKLKTENLGAFLRILNFLSSIPPGKVTTNSLSNKIGLDNKTVNHYLMILKRTGLIRMLYPAAEGSHLLTKPDKIFLDNTTLLTTLNKMLSGELNRGTVRELVFLQLIDGADLSVFYPKQGDFQVGDIVFEVGGKNKTWHQLKSFKGEKYLVKDDVLIGVGNEIPLYLFGFLY